MKPSNLIGIMMSGKEAKEAAFNILVNLAESKELNKTEKNTVIIAKEIHQGNFHRSRKNRKKEKENSVNNNLS